jgi:hypothetical protein
MFEAAGEKRERVGRIERQDLQQLQAHGTAREEVESQDDTSDRGDQWLQEAVKQPEAVKPADQAVRPDSLETPLSFASSAPMNCNDKLSSVPTPEDDEQLIDCSSSPERMELEDN